MTCFLAKRGRVSAHGLRGIEELHRDASRAAGFKDGSMQAMRFKIKGKVRVEGGGVVGPWGSEAALLLSASDRVLFCLRSGAIWSVPLPGV